MPVPTVAVVGRPNVGKSLLFNKIAGRRLSIVEDTPGVTRDRLFAEAEWRGRAFTLVDTGGIEFGSARKLAVTTPFEVVQFIRVQAEIAIQNADVVIFVVDLRTGPTSADEEVAVLIRKAGKPVVLAVNKTDVPGPPSGDVFDFFSLGVGPPFAISALHGIGIGDLLDACFAHFPPEEEQAASADRRIAVAVIGRPNVGKSSLVNRLLGHERVIVSDRPGTTRDAVDSFFENEHGSFTLIDTAGIRRKAKMDSAIEHYSALRAAMAVERADVCLVLLDAVSGISEQDARVAGLAHDAGKAAILVVNKWDAVDKNNETVGETEARIRTRLAYMPYAPILFLSALTGQRVGRIFPMIVEIDAQSSRRIATGALNNLLADAVARVQPPTDRGKRLKVFYMTQTGTRPPHFVAFCNDAELFHYSYRRYLENRIRETYGFSGTPIRISIRERSGQDGSV